MTRQPQFRSKRKGTRSAEVVKDQTDLTETQIAHKLGVKPNTITSYKARGYLDKPDKQEGRHPLYTRRHEETWEATRPGQGVGGGRPPKREAAKKKEEAKAPRRRSPRSK